MVIRSFKSSLAKRGVGGDKEVRKKMKEIKPLDWKDLKMTGLK